jgi:ADP-ribose pyrophosphatase YjhB (NUDIX family)
VPDHAPFSHCSFCGHRFSGQMGWPRTCAACGNVTYRNPLPVAVVVVPVAGEGVLMVRRVESPAGLAFPSGFVEHGERWQDTAARELAEETGVRVDPAAVRAVRVSSDTDGTLLVFATVPAISRDDLAAFTPTAEVSELVVLDRAHEDVVFPLDAEVLAEHLAGDG